MPTEKSRVYVTFDAETIELLNSYAEQAGITSKSAAALELIRIALEDMRKTGELPARKPPVLRRKDRSDEHLEKYLNLDSVGKEIVDGVIDVVVKHVGVFKYDIDNPDDAAQKFKEDFILEKKAQEEFAHSGATSTA